MKALIVMPTATADIKVDVRCAALAAKCCFTAQISMKRKRKRSNCHSSRVSPVPPFDHPMVIAGQRTLALEPLQQVDAHLDRVFVPWSAARGLQRGGAIAQLMPQIKVIAEAEDSACLESGAGCGSSC
ncbi:hypothetical protein [Escherichia coli]|uniref:hypothetical protein n=1 Tax=Escherichia coli TaxID=562 RepID=UPI00388FAF00